MVIWEITKDKVCDGEDAGVKGPRGYDAIKSRLDGMGDEDKGTIKFRMLDDDGEICYYGEMTTDDPGGEDLFAPLDHFGTPNAGCTSIQIREAGQWKTV